MDSLVTGHAGIIVLAVPFAFWLRVKARANYNQELLEIKKLTAERSQLLNELHSRLDVLDKKDSRWEPTANKQDTARQLFLMLAYCKPIADTDADLKKWT